MNAVNGFSCCLLVAAGVACGLARATDPSRMPGEAVLRQELRSFYPDWGQGEDDVVKDVRQPDSYRKIEADVVAYCAINPDFDALDVRRECYLAMRRHFVPFLFWNGYIDSVMDVDGANYLSIMGIVERTVYRDSALERRLRLVIDSIDDAQAHPERYPNLFVRVCGFSARFIHLSKRWQDEVIARHRLNL